MALLEGGGAARLCENLSDRFRRVLSQQKNTQNWFSFHDYGHFFPSTFFALSSLCVCLARLIFDSRLTRLATTGSVPKNIGLFLLLLVLVVLLFFLFFFFATLFATVNRRFSASQQRAIHF